MVLQTAWSAAQAVEKFGDRLEQLRMAVDELSGGKFGGEVRPLRGLDVMSPLI